MSLKNWNQLLFVVIIVAIIFAIIPFLVIFSKQSFSTKLNDWADAASWLSLFVTIITTVFLGYISWNIHENEKRRDSDMKSLLTNIEKPILTFFSTAENGSSNIDRWWIRNVGKGAALNLSVAHFPSEGQTWNNTLTDCYSLGGDGSTIQLTWLNKTLVNKLLVFYNDTLTDRVHVSICYSDKTIVSSLDNFIELRDINSNLILSKEDLNDLYIRERKRQKQAEEDIRPNFKPTITFR
jgi:hypothetical protein